MTIFRWLPFPKTGSARVYFLVTHGCWGHLCSVVGSKPYIMKHLEPTVVAIWHYIFVLSDDPTLLQ